MRKLRNSTALLLLISASACFAADCPKKEYAEYKDQALTPMGRSGMAFDYCRAEGRRKIALEEAELAIQYKQFRDSNAALAAVDSCTAEKSKIENALTAAKATKTLAFMRGGCAKGTYNIGDK